MALSPNEQVLEALKAALDQVPLTAEQRQKTLSEFALRIGLPVFTGASSGLSSFGSLPIMDSKQALQQALHNALDAAHSTATPITQQDRSTVQQDLIARLQSRLESGVDGIDHSAIQGLVRDSLIRERRRGTISFTVGLFYAIAEAVIISALLVTALLLGVSMKMLDMPLILTVTDIFIVCIGLQLLGSLHERIWISSPAVFNIMTLIRGLLSPLTVTFGLLILAHERLWGDYTPNKTGRILRSLIAPITVPIGAIWNTTGSIIRQLEKLSPHKSSVPKTVLALTESKNNDSEKAMKLGNTASA